MNSSFRHHNWTWKHALAVSVISGSSHFLLPGINVILAVIFILAGGIFIRRGVSGSRRILAESVFVCGIAILLVLAILVLSVIFGMNEIEIFPELDPLSSATQK